MADEKRDTVVSARFTKSEADRLRGAAGDRSLAQLLRDIAMNHLEGDVAAPPAPVGRLGFGSTHGHTGTVTMSNVYGLTAPLRRTEIVSGTQVSVGTV